jgi:glucose/arabinose dehydrogenase/PKD repeat protein
MVNRNRSLRTNPGIRGGAPFLAAALALVPAAAHAVTLPAGFTAVQVAPSGSWDKITGLAFAPDGRLFVIEKRGRVHVVENNVKVEPPFLDLELDVLNNADRGLLGIALAPDFARTGHVYLLHTADPDRDGSDDEGSSFGRLVRYTVSASNPNAADLSSRRILIGQTWADGIPSLTGTHGIGSIRFASDGTLLLSAGDGAHVSTPDAGGRDPGAFQPGRIPVSQDIGAFRSQWLGSLGGKILRLDPATGEGVPSNPYFTGNPADNASRVWAYGLRNPYRFTVRPGTGSSDPAAGSPGVLFIGDVGWDTWEEISVTSPGGGDNFGWPCREGPEATRDYPALGPAHHGCESVGSPENPAPQKAPALTWHHSNPALSQPPGIRGRCTSGLAFYTGTRYPALYQGACFFADYDGAWIHAARFDGTGNLIEVLDFAEGTAGPVEIVADPVTGDLFYVSILRNEIRRLIHDPTNSPPRARIFATPNAGAAPLAVRFSSLGATDPDGDPLTFLWSFGDGTTASEQHPTHIYRQGGIFTATVTADDGRGGQGSASATITVQGGAGANRPPAPRIIEPTAGEVYFPRVEVRLHGEATDPDHAADQLRYDWELVLHHDTHVHPAWLTLSGSDVFFLPQDHDNGQGIFLEAILRVTDPGGLTGTAHTFIYPPAQPLILDNGNPGTSAVGTWRVSPAPFPFGPDSLFSNLAGNSYSYSFAVPEPGNYRVYAWWTVLSTRTGAAVHEIHHARGRSTVTVDQRDEALADHWNLLGEYVFDAAATVSVIASGQGSTSADAMLLLPSPRTNQKPAARIERIQPNPAAAGEPISFTGRGDDDRQVAAYHWRSSLDGALSDQPSFTTTALSPGLHLISFQVEDDEGEPSAEAVALLEVRLPSTVEEFIIDDGDPGTLASGWWATSSGQRPYGAGSLYAARAGDAYRFAKPLARPGVFDVYAWWTSWPSRTSQATYLITYDGAAQRILADQRTGGGAWRFLGTYGFGAAAEVSVIAAGNGTSTCADAVRFVFRPDDRIIDAGDAGTVLGGEWSSVASNQSYGGDSFLLDRVPGRTTWYFEVAAPGRYEVHAWWTSAPDRSPSARYVIVSAAGESEARADQTRGAGRWNRLGSFPFAGEGSVRLEAVEDGRSYAADAILIRRAGGPGETPRVPPREPAVFERAGASQPR